MCPHVFPTFTRYKSSPRILKVNYYNDENLESKFEMHWIKKRTMILVHPYLVFLSTSISRLHFPIIPTITAGIVVLYKVP